MQRKSLLASRFTLLKLPISIVLLAVGTAAGQNVNPLRVRAEFGPGPYFVGQAIELRVGIVAGSSRPKVDPPRLTGARVWTTSTELRPLSATGIGSVVAQENLFVFRFHLLPARAGTLEVPAIQASLNGRSGRSQPRKLSVQPVPLPGRPSEFLGGVGRFDVQAEAVPKIVRIGQELEFRIKVVGPAALGMTDRPELKRFEGLKLGLRIDPRPDESTDEPPIRTFVYRLRPTHPGDAVLPPVAIAAYDPSLSTYVTHVTAGVAVRVVAVPSLDPNSIDDDSPSTALSWPMRIASATSLLVVAVVGTYLGVRVTRRRLNRPASFGPERARRFARTITRSPRRSYGNNACAPIANLESGIRDFPGDPAEVIDRAGRRIHELVAEYLRQGTGHSPGVVTPEDARQGVELLTNSHEIAQAASELIARCDRVLYRDLPGRPDEESGALLDGARRLFEALGRVKKRNRTDP